MKAFTIVVFLSIILWSCKVNPILDPIIIDDPVSEKVTIKASAMNGLEIEPRGTLVLEKGSSVLFTIKVKDGYSIDSIIINDKTVFEDNDSSFKISSLLIDTDIMFKGVSDSILFLTDGSENQTDPWYLTKIDYFDLNNNFLRSSDLNQEELTNKVWYYRDLNYTMADSVGRIIFTNGKWDLQKGIFTNGGADYVVVELTASKFSYQRLVPYLGKQAWVRITKEKKGI
jgi:hypothetical protein